MVGATSRCRFASRFGDSHGFVARKPWLSLKRLMLFFKRRAAENAEEGFRKELCVLRDSAFQVLQATAQAISRLICQNSQNRIVEVCETV